jgi:hypothetical protein
MGGSNEVINLSSLSLSLSQPTGLAVDSDGFVYLATYSSPYYQVVKINPEPPSSPTIVARSTAPLSTPYDILVHDGYVYVSDPGSSPPSIVRLTKNLQFVDSFRGPANDPFLGPERFVATLNEPITVIDEAFGGNGDRLVSFNSMTGAGWVTCGETGSSGAGTFQFYSMYTP